MTETSIGRVSVFDVDLDIFQITWNKRLWDRLSRNAGAEKSYLTQGGGSHVEGVGCRATGATWAIISPHSSVGKSSSQVRCLAVSASPSWKGEGQSLSSSALSDKNHRQFPYKTCTRKEP